MSAQAFHDPNHRQMGMASDEANTNFVGARNPDDALWVQFYDRKIPDAYATALNNNEPVFRDKVFVRIEVPGRTDLQIDVEADDTHRRRFPRQWKEFLTSSGAVGTPIEQMGGITPEMLEQLTYLRFKTVEMVAMASDESISRLGMSVGMAPTAFRDKARAFLADQASGFGARRQAEELAKRDAIIEEMRDQMKQLMALVKPSGAAPEIADMQFDLGKRVRKPTLKVGVDSNSTSPQNAPSDERVL